MVEVEEGTLTIVEEKVDSSRYPSEPGDHDRYSHYVHKKDYEAAVFGGSPIKALCGKVWVPNRDPKRFPVCQACKDIFNNVIPPHPDDVSPNG